MKTRFIVGTNEQYSIREDGQVIRNYRWDKWGNKLIKERIIKIHFKLKKNSKSSMVTIGYPQQQHSIRRLMETYFDIEGKPSKILGFKDNDKNNYKLSNLYYKQPKSKQLINKEARNKAIQNLHRWYIASKLSIPVEDLTNELYNHHKQLITFKREVAVKHNLHITTLR